MSNRSCDQRNASPLKTTQKMVDGTAHCSRCHPSNPSLFPPSPRHARYNQILRATFCRLHAARRCPGVLCSIRVSSDQISARNRRRRLARVATSSSYSLSRKPLRHGRPHADDDAIVRECFPTNLPLFSINFYLHRLHMRLRPYSRPVLISPATLITNRTIHLLSRSSSLTLESISTLYLSFSSNLYLSIHPTIPLS